MSHEAPEAKPRVLDCAGRSLDLSRIAIMGILNVTPDSFSDGGAFSRLEQAIDRAREMVDEGVDIIDIGAESTRPGASGVSADEQLKRAVPVIEACARAFAVPLSIDTSEPAVMRAAIAAGAGFINDVRALRVPGALAAAVELGVPVCLMHMQGEPATMQRDPRYRDVVAEVREFLRQRIEAAVDAGVLPGRLVVDPGFGFGKTGAHNLGLLRGMRALLALGCPVLAGLSRKSIAHTLGASPVERRTGANVALALIAVANGARILRVHDVASTVEAVRMYEAVYGGESPPPIA